MLNLRYPHHDRGFTLIELLVAIAITGIVITLTGSGLYTLMNANQRSQTETSERLELEQAVAFMADEIKMSKQIDLAPESYKIRNFNPALDSEKFKPIIVLTPATNSKLPDPIVYYIAIPPRQSVWIGNRVIYRWGPTLLQNGNYSDGKGNDIATIPIGASIEYYNEVLVDRIGDIISDEAKSGCDSSYPNEVPIVAKRLGFYACVAADGKSVKLWMHKQPNSSGKIQSINALVRTRSN
jgi:prepilin-type N-terminal cleavage/methylation domain-containing protein